MTELQTNAFERITCHLGEMFDDYLIIAKPHKHGIIVHSSDATWALGAVKRLAILQEHHDRQEDKND